MDVHFSSQLSQVIEDRIKQRDIPETREALHVGSFLGKAVVKVDSMRNRAFSNASTQPMSQTASHASLEDDVSVNNEEWDSTIWTEVDDAPWIKVQQNAEKILQESQPLLKQVVFHPQAVQKLQTKIQRQQEIVKEMLETASQAACPEGEELILLSNVQNQLRELNDRLVIKGKMLSQYLEGDPFNNKHVLYPRRVYAEAAKLIFEKQLLNLPEAKCEELRIIFDEWYQNEVSRYEDAEVAIRSRSSEFYLSNENRENPLRKYNAERATKILNKIFLKPTSILEVEQAAGKVINEHLDWKMTQRDMIFSLRGQIGVYTQISTPLSESATAVGVHLQVQGVHGITPFVRDDGRAPINARMTQLFKVEEKNHSLSGESPQKTLLHERQQHGINDHFLIQDPKKRHDANVASMRQLVQSAAETDADFIRDAIKHADEQHQIFYINTNLTTPTWTPRGNKNNEEAYSRHQGNAMRAIENEGRVQTFSVLNPDAPEQRVNIDVEVICIDFRFPVNYAISDISEDQRALDPGMLFAWPQLRAHNEKELRKFFGRLDTSAPITGLLEETFNKLCKKAEEDPHSDAEMLKNQVQQQVEHLRKMFQTDAYQRANGDRFKMPRHIDLLVNVFRRASELVNNHKIRIVNAGGCLSGKDREGVANAESEAATIIQDLGGTVNPGQGGRSDEEAQAIYDHCMTGVVYNTRQVTGIGGSKNVKEIANQMRDLDAMVYAQGGSQFVAT